MGAALLEQRRIALAPASMPPSSFPSRALRRHGGQGSGSSANPEDPHPYQVADVFPIELTVYERRELRFRPRSSTDGKPIERIRESALSAILARDHAEAWARYLAEGTIDGLDVALDDDDDGDGGAFDGLLEAGIDCELEAPEPGEADDPGQLYDPLPGFEDPGAMP